MSDTNSEIKTVAGHPKAQTVGGMRVTGKNEKRAEEPEAAGDAQVAQKPQLIIGGALTNEQKDYPTEAVKHMQQKPIPTKEPKHVQNNSQQNRNIHQPR